MLCINFTTSVSGVMILKTKTCKKNLKVTEVKKMIKKLIRLGFLNLQTRMKSASLVMKNLQTRIKSVSLVMSMKSKRIHLKNSLLSFILTASFFPTNQMTSLLVNSMDKRLFTANNFFWVRSKS